MIRRGLVQLPRPDVMDQELLIMGARGDQMLKKAEEIRERGLTVVGMMHMANVIKVVGDPRKLEGMTGVTIRKAETMRTTK